MKKDKDSFDKFIERAFSKFLPWGLKVFGIKKLLDQTKIEQFSNMNKWVAAMLGATGLQVIESIVDYFAFEKPKVNKIRDLIDENSVLTNHLNNLRAKESVYKRFLSSEVNVMRKVLEIEENALNDITDSIIDRNALDIDLDEIVLPEDLIRSSYYPERLPALDDNIEAWGENLEKVEFLWNEAGNTRRVPVDIFKSEYKEKPRDFRLLKLQDPELGKACEWAYLEKKKKLLQDKLQKESDPIVWNMHELANITQKLTFLSQDLISLQTALRIENVELANKRLESMSKTTITDENAAFNIKVYLIERKLCLKNYTFPIEKTWLNVGKIQFNFRGANCKQRLELFKKEVLSNPNKMTEVDKSYLLSNFRISEKDGIYKVKNMSESYKDYLDNLKFLNKYGSSIQNIKDMEQEAWIEMIKASK